MFKITIYNSDRSNILIEYSSYKVIKSYEAEKGNSPGGIYFNKSMSLINSILKTQGIDMKLPHCWYRWGDEVVKYYMPYEIKWNNEEAAYTKVSWEGDTPDFPEIGVKNKIDNIVSDILKKYSDYGSLSDFIDLIYENAPFEFQRKYRYVREFFYLAKEKNKSINEPVKDILLPQINDALQSFPEDVHFNTVREFIPAFKRYVEYFAVSKRKDYNELEEVSEEFWFWFSYFLRLHPNAHENVSNETIMIWKEKLKSETENFYFNFTDHVLNISRDIKDVRHDEILGSYVIKAESEGTDYIALFADFRETVNELDEFLKENENRFHARNLNN